MWLIALWRWLMGGTDHDGEAADEEEAFNEWEEDEEDEEDEESAPLD